LLNLCKIGLISIHIIDINKYVAYDFKLLYNSLPVIVGEIIEEII
tara:strand:- start:1220 stop:1354 length:135 start_codon:yes stop_codon:yes gene_type:complete